MGDQCSELPLSWLAAPCLLLPHDVGLAAADPGIDIVTF